MPTSPWLAVTRSGGAVQDSTARQRLAGSGSTSAEVLNEIGIPGHEAGTARSSRAAGPAARVCRPTS